MSDQFRGGEAPPADFYPPQQSPQTFRETVPARHEPTPPLVVAAPEPVVPEVEPEHPRETLRRIRATLAGNHTDVRDHLGVVTRALHDLIGLMHDALPAEHATVGGTAGATEDENGEGH